MCLFLANIFSDFHRSLCLHIAPPQLNQDLLSWNGTLETGNLRETTVQSTTEIIPLLLYLIPSWADMHRKHLRRKHFQYPLVIMWVYIVGAGPTPSHSAFHLQSIFCPHILLCSSLQINHKPTRISRGTNPEIFYNPSCIQLYLLCYCSSCIIWGRFLLAQGESSSVYWGYISDFSLLI